MENTDPIALNKILSKHFNLEEIQALCFEMKIEYEDLSGQARSAKVLELVKYAQRRSRLDELATHVYTRLEQMPQQDMTAVDQEEIIQLLQSIQADVKSLLTAVDK